MHNECSKIAQDFCESKIVSGPAASRKDEWEHYASKIPRKALQKAHPFVGFLKHNVPIRTQASATHHLSRCYAL